MAAAETYLMSNRWIALGFWSAGAGWFVWILIAQDWSEAPAVAGVGWGIGGAPL